MWSDSHLKYANVQSFLLVWLLFANHKYCITLLMTSWTDIFAVTNRTGVLRAAKRTPVTWLIMTKKNISLWLAEKAREYFFNVHVASSRDLGLGVFSKVMQTLSVSGLYNCLEFSKYLSCLLEATWVAYNMLYGISIDKGRFTLLISVLMSCLQWIYFMEIKNL